ncbi:MULTISPECIES: efflux RND transporter periplasmic adaptor subunit [Pseudomonadaceae]|uniref:efflux RND transporter periplasmic adaptor subunit n=1 Tax=Pseudomonadaceae TaxID=135621 RepID=UPI000F76993C|nr:MULTISPECIES: efflux RND transporter periplasmic adaptor subunit [Pseudomonadaceae]MBA1262357.1 efflux RND transporter periplasmic adaptor subunit [Stutzerimonas stutzeri]RRV15599.1 efflux RND transporter periplasmic adaptor subunit [Pseudomonas saudiphocaensis]
MSRLSAPLFALGLLTLSVTPSLWADELLLELQTSSATPINDRQVRGVLRARNQAVLASELPGRIVEMPFRDGQDFKKGDVLARFDCSAYQAQLSAAQAATRATREELNHKKQLAALNSVGRFEVALAEARQAQALAEAQVYQVQVKRCNVVAPFNGRVVQRRAQPHESVANGAPLLDVVDNGTLEIYLLVPSSWLSRIKAEQPFEFTPDETGTPLRAMVKRLGARIDEGSQTLLLIGSLPEDASGLLAGMSGNARFPEAP